MRIIGRKPVLELLESDQSVQSVRIQLGTQGRIIGQIIRAAKTRGVRVDRVPADVAKRTFGGENHQGVVAEVAPTPLHELDELGKGVPVRSGLLVALDSITDPHHLGAIARSALAAGCDGLILPQRRSAPLSEVAIKASAGTLLRLPLIRAGNLSDALEWLKKEGWWIAGAAGEGAVDLWEHEWAERSVLVMGSEGSGLGKRVASMCDHLLRIPMAAGVESLSVSAAASVLLFDVARKRKA